MRTFSTNSRPALRAASGRPPARQPHDGHRATGPTQQQRGALAVGGVASRGFYDDPATQRQGRLDRLSVPQQRRRALETSGGKLARYPSRRRAAAALLRAAGLGD